MAVAKIKKRGKSLSDIKRDLTALYNKIQPNQLVTFKKPLL